MRPDARLLVVEPIAPEREFRELLAAAGLRVTRIVETIAMLSVIEARPL